MDADIFKVLIFDKSEIEYLQRLVMQDYLSSDAGKMEDDRNKKLRLKLKLQNDAYEDLQEWLALAKQTMH